MTPPRQLVRVEWAISRDFERPEDRVEKAANFASLSSAARQIRSVLSWVPSHAELLAVYRTGASRRNRYTLHDGDRGIGWDRIDPAEILRFLPAHEEARYRALELDRAGADPSEIHAALVAGTDGEEPE